jgi:NhaA family Na+:H+ antiporter
LRAIALAWGRWTPDDTTPYTMNSQTTGPAPEPDLQKHSMFEEFFHSEVTGSVLLMIAAVAALVWANSPWSAQYFDLAHTYVGVSFGDAAFKLSLRHWVNDGLMAVFFFVIGLEIKREIVVGELSSLQKAVLPVTAAVGGMVVPALFYVLVIWLGGGAHAEAYSGWGIPMATDIAFALGILSLFGKRVPLSLKVFLTALAIADDLGAIVVIALFYTESISFLGLGIAASFLFAIFLASRIGVRSLLLYALLAICGWAGLLVSGIHATIGGVVVAMLVPVTSKLAPRDFFRRTAQRLKELKGAKISKTSMVTDNKQLKTLNDMYLAVEDMRPVGVALEHLLHPVQVFLILPLFAFLNAGVALDGEVLSTAVNPITFAILAGLMIGKPVGVLLFSWLAIKSGKASLPTGVSWKHLIGVGCLAGVGFTMSIFISDLAFTDTLAQSWSKTAILVGSLGSGLLGYFTLRSACR